MKMQSLVRWLAILLCAQLLSGCVSATRVVRPAGTTIKEYSEVYIIRPTVDRRNVLPRAVSEFKAMGLNVKVVDGSKPLEGGQGTGFVVSPDGHVLTCAHVLADEQVATLWISNVRYEADVLSKDAERDLALLKVRQPSPAKFTPLSLRHDRRYSLGAEIFTIGFPLSKILGSSARFTRGTISATSGLNDDPKQLQVSAETHPGNSGGPLFDKHGVVLGVIQQTLNPAAVFAQTGGSLPQNVNFAIKTGVVLDYLEAAHKDVVPMLSFDKAASVEDAQKSVVKVRAGIVDEAAEKQLKLVAQLEYVSIWDIWYRFRFFAVRLYDFDSRQLVIAAGQGRDNLVSTEDVVIKDTFAEIRKALRKN